MKPEKKFGKPPLLFKINIDYLKYESLIRYFKKAETKEMLYLYFDTDLSPEKAKLLAENVRLRVRIRERCYSLELKFKKAGSSQDFSQSISIFELYLISVGQVPEGIVRQKLLLLNLLNKVMLVGSSHTTRSKSSFQQGVIVLDRTISENQAYFQVEFRSNETISQEKLGLIKEELGVAVEHSFQSKLKLIWGKKNNKQFLLNEQKEV